MRDPASETTPAEAMWAVWSTMPDPATVVRSLIRMPVDADIARLASGALACERAEDFFEHRDDSAASVIRKLVALDRLDVGPDEAPGPAVDKLVARAQAWGGDAWADAVLDAWAAIGQARTVRDRLAHRSGVTAQDLAPVIPEHSGALSNWCFAMLCTTMLIHEIASAGSEEVLAAVRRLLVDSGVRSYRSLRGFELSLADLAEQALPFAGSLSDEERSLEEAAQVDSEAALGLVERG
jgi:hypothetical protein